jgi:glucosyl-3-phosphoglycerate synthase
MSRQGEVEPMRASSDAKSEQADTGPGLELEEWRAQRSYAAEDFPLQRLLRAKRESIALVLPAREVAATIGPIAERAARLREAGLLDEVLVIDAGSRDDSAQIAAAAGLQVVQEDEVASELGPALGKGDAMWRALQLLDSEIVAYLDTDGQDIGDRFITGLLGPLVCETGVHFVKGSFRRPFRGGPGETPAPEGGGRVTELMARPLLNLYAPELTVFDQPLAGETAARRELLEQIPFSAGYGVEIAMLIDAWRTVGLQGMAQVDLGVRQNSHQPLRALSAMAYAVLIAAQTRFLGPESATHFAGCSTEAAEPLANTESESAANTEPAAATAGFAGDTDFAWSTHTQGSILLPPPPTSGDLAMETRRVVVAERPPLASYGRNGAGRLA